MIDRMQEDLVCSDGHNGKAVLRLDGDGTVRAIAYYHGTAGAGTVYSFR